MLFYSDSLSGRSFLTKGESSHTRYAVYSASPSDRNVLTKGESSNSCHFVVYSVSLSDRGAAVWLKARVHMHVMLYTPIL